MNTEPKTNKEAKHPTEKAFLFVTTGGMPILATPSEFKKNWLHYIVERNEAYTVTPVEEVR